MQTGTRKEENCKPERAKEKNEVCREWPSSSRSTCWKSSSPLVQKSLLPPRCLNDTPLAEFGLPVISQGQWSGNDFRAVEWKRFFYRAVRQLWRIGKKSCFRPKHHLPIKTSRQIVMDSRFLLGVLQIQRGNDIKRTFDRFVNYNATEENRCKVFMECTKTEKYL